MTYNECITALRTMAADQLGYYHCYGCGHEHNCATEGCAILREALAQMEQLHKDLRGDCCSCTHAATPPDKPPCDNCIAIRFKRKVVGTHWDWRGVVEKED